MGGAGGAAAAAWRTIRIFARGISSVRRVHLRMDFAPGDANWWDGGGGRHIRALFSGRNTSGFRGRLGCSFCAGVADSDQLPGRARGKHDAKLADVAEDLRHRGARDLWLGVHGATPSDSRIRARISAVLE